MTHLIDGQFQSDKYAWSKPGFVPLKITDAMAQELLWQYARRRRSVDSEFSDDLETALKWSGYSPDNRSDAREGTWADIGCYVPYTCQAGRGDPPMDCIYPHCFCGDAFIKPEYRMPTESDSAAESIVASIAPDECWFCVNASVRKGLSGKVLRHFDECIHADSGKAPDEARNAVIAELKRMVRDPNLSVEYSPVLMETIRFLSKRDSK